MQLRLKNATNAVSCVMVTREPAGPVDLPVVKMTPKERTTFFTAETQPTVSPDSHWPPSVAPLELT
jgi:hypothetical protein